MYFPLFLWVRWQISAGLARACSWGAQLAGEWAGLEAPRWFCSHVWKLVLAVVWGTSYPAAQQISFFEAWRPQGSSCKAAKRARQRLQGLPGLGSGSHTASPLPQDRPRISGREIDFAVVVVVFSFYFFSYGIIDIQHYISLRYIM